MSESIIFRPRVLIFGRDENQTTQVEERIHQVLADVFVETRAQLQFTGRSVSEDLPQDTVLVVLTGELTRHGRIRNISDFFARKAVNMVLCSAEKELDFQLLSQALIAFKSSIDAVTSLKMTNTSKNYEQGIDQEGIERCFDAELIQSIGEEQLWKVLTCILRDPHFNIQSDEDLFGLYLKLGQNPSNWPDGIGEKSLSLLREYLIRKKFLKK